MEKRPANQVSDSATRGKRALIARGRAASDVPHDERPVRDAGVQKHFQPGALAGKRPDSPLHGASRACKISCFSRVTRHASGHRTYCTNDPR